MVRSLLAVFTFAWVFSVTLGCFPGSKRPTVPGSSSPAPSAPGPSTKPPPVVTNLLLPAASVSFNGNGKFSWYNAVGSGACGTQIDAAHQLLAAVPAKYWTSANANNDPLCSKCLHAVLGENVIHVPIRDKCPSCTEEKVDLSKPAFAKLGNLDLGIIEKASWAIVDC